jgi:hypothetical protein
MWILIPMALALIAGVDLVASDGHTHDTTSCQAACR